jgi:Subtilase family
VPTVPATGEPDYRVFVGARTFDPKDEAPSARRQVSAARRRRAAVSGPAPRDLGGEPLLVQFTSRLGAPDIERLRSAYGLTFADYIPNLAFLEVVSAQAIAALRSDFLVRTTMAIDPAMKLAPQIESGPPAPGVEPVFAAVLLRGADASAVEADLTALGAHDVLIQDDRASGGGLVARFVLDDPTLTAQVADIEEVVWIEPVGLGQDDANVDAVAAIHTGTLDGAPIWDRGLHGEGHIMGFMDGGPPDIRHCFFADDAPNTPGPNHRKIAAPIRNATGTAPARHATLTAGMAAGDDRNLPGSSRHRGGVWAARLVCGNRFDVAVGAQMVGELNAAAAAGAFVHTNSWHWNTNRALLPARGAAPLYDLLSWAVDSFTFQNEDHLVLGSAGNTGEELGPPGTAKNAICVACAQAKPNQMNFGDGNSGPTADGRRKPDLMAVGCGIDGATVNTGCSTSARPCATSYATPNAAAAAVLVRQYFQEGWYPSGEKEAKNAFNPTGALLKAVLLNSTVDMTGPGVVAGYPSNAEGWGLIRLDRTLTFRGDRRRMKVWDRRHAVGASPPIDIIDEDFQVDEGTDQLKVTLVWTDPPPFAFGFLQAPPVNDLNLKVTAPDGTAYVGNDFTNGVSTPNGTTADAVNNVEMVVVNSPKPGKWVLEVHGVINNGNPNQGYALVATANLKRKCFVATAVYGDAEHPDVRFIREWRDGTIAGGGARGAAMRAFSAVYDRAGPRLAGVVERHAWLGDTLRRRVFRPAVARRRAR